MAHPRCHNSNPPLASQTSTTSPAAHTSVPFSPCRSMLSIRNEIMALINSNLSIFHTLESSVLVKVFRRLLLTCLNLPVSKLRADVRSRHQLSYLFSLNTESSTINNITMSSTGPKPKVLQLGNINQCVHPRDS
jgi:hypothetical protein